MAHLKFPFSDHENQILRGPNFANFREQGSMEKILDWLWTPLLALFAALWQKAHRNSVNIEILVKSHEILDDHIHEANDARRHIYDKIEAVRAELASQHATLRVEQRSDFKEIRDTLKHMQEK
jgi:hypothetical protein